MNRMLMIRKRTPERHQMQPWRQRHTMFWFRSSSNFLLIF